MFFAMFLFRKMKKGEKVLLEMCLKIVFFRFSTRLDKLRGKVERSGCRRIHAREKETTWKFRCVDYRGNIEL